MSREIVALLPPLLALAAWGAVARHLMPDSDLSQRASAAMAALLLGWLCAKAARLREFPALETALIGAPMLATGIWLWVDQRLASAALLTVGAMLLGISASRGLDRLALMAPAIIAAAAMDVHSFASGPTSTLFDSPGNDSAAPPTPELVELLRLLVQIPVPDGTWLFGSIDVAAIALLCAAAHRFGLPVWRTALATALASAAVIMVGRPAPVLPAIAAAFVLVNARPLWMHLRHSLRRLRVR